jgi:hypothetical protein
MLLFENPCLNIKNVEKEVSGKRRFPTISSNICLRLSFEKNLKISKQEVMYTTYHFTSAQDISSDILDAIKANFKSRPITILVDDGDSVSDLSENMNAASDEQVQERESTYLSAEASISHAKRKIVKQVVLNIPDNKYLFFMELVNSLGFVKVSAELNLNKKQKAFVVGTRNSLEQVEQHLKGQIGLKTAGQLYNEL